MTKVINNRQYYFTLKKRLFGQCVVPKHLHTLPQLRNWKFPEEGGFQDQNNKKKGMKVSGISSEAGGVDFMELNN